MDQKTIDNNFTCHTPNLRTIPLFETICKEGKEFVERIDKLCPESREKTIAIRKIEESVMWANASIARNKG
jgi:hypothetical protein